MSLFIVSTPIGHKDDISIRALNILREAEIIIGEERKDVSSLLKLHCINNKNIYLLNEHTPTHEIIELTELCRKHKVALVSDCGTPGFCDPGAILVKNCRKQKIEVRPIVGASSLMALLSICGLELKEFVFRGFLSPESQIRKSQLKMLEKELRAVILMDTPYRLSRLLEDLKNILPHREILIGIELTSDFEEIYEGRAEELIPKLMNIKKPFILLLKPQDSLNSSVQKKITTKNNPFKTSFKKKF